MSTTIKGIDVSKHQGSVNWSKVKASGKQFAMIRLGWCGYDGGIQANKGLDSSFYMNMAGALKAGLNVGVYVYSYAKTPAAARVAARETLELVKSYALAYPIAFDMEDELNTKMSREDNTAIVTAFLSEVEKAGYYGILYTYKHFAESFLNMNQLAAYDVWIAQYADKCTYTGRYGMWQYAGDTGRCDGVTGGCDLNFAYKDYAAIIQAAGLNNPDNATNITQEALEEALLRVADLEDAIARIKTFVEQF